MPKIRCTYVAQSRTLNALAWLGRRQATALRVKRTPDAAAMQQRAMSAVQFSCRWRQRRTVKRDRNRSSHHLEQNPYPSGRVQPVECPNEIGKRASQDPYLLSFDEVII